ncbi:hypothetical protein [Streptosporangium vulgare]|uniref:Uncharacterized protein n=1 Tax=Streptosporangium vulgare TaxID=46190 RepID=A0ABV5TQC0_9ACTN
MNRFPADDEGDFSDLRTAVDEIQALLRTRAPLIEASRGWILRQMSQPSIPPSGDVHIYASGGRLRALSTLDDVPLVNRQGAAVAIAANMTSGTIAGSPTMAQYNALYNDVVEVRAQLNALINSLRAGTVILT